MDIEQWWPKLKPSTKEWLIAHNGEDLPDEVSAEIRRAGGVFETGEADGSSVDQDDASGVVLSDDAIDWIEAVANEEPLGTDSR